MSDQPTDPTGAPHALDLGNDHWIDWCIAGDGDDTRVGVIVWHTLPPGAPDHLGNGMCACGPSWAPTNWQLDHPDRFERSHSRWTLHGAADEHLTLSPSILCSCGDHGFIQGGKWVRA
jgi:hypothetical protein